MWSFVQENESLLLILGVASVVLFLLSLALIIWIILRIPADYFSRPQRQSLVPQNLHPSIRILLLLVKNAVGLIIVLLGIAMLVLPGQGLLAILIGVALVDFPRKYQLQRWLISRGPVLKSANWLRAKGNRKPLEMDVGENSS